MAAGRSAAIDVGAEHAAGASQVLRAVREPEEVHEPRAGDDALVVHAAVNPRQLLHERELARRARGEVGVAGLRRRRHEPAVHVVQHRFAEAGARGDERGVAGRRGDRLPAAPPARQARGRAPHSAIASRSFSSRDGAVAEPLRHRGRVSEPGHVRQPRDQPGDRSGDADADGVHRARAGLVEEGLDDVVEAVEVERARTRGRSATGRRLRAPRASAGQGPVRQASRRGPAASSFLRRRRRGAWPAR